MIFQHQSQPHLGTSLQAWISFFYHVSVAERPQPPAQSPHFAPVFCLIVGPLDKHVSRCLDLLEISAHIFELCFCSHSHPMSCQDVHSTRLEVF